MGSVDVPPATDVVVVGSGAAGCAAAAAAREMGLEACILEKADTLGGGTVYSYGGVWVGCNALQEEAGIEDDRADVAAYLRYLAAGFGDEDHIRTFVDRAPLAIRFFSGCGVPFQIVRRVPDHYYPRAPGSRAEGRLLEAALFPAESLGLWHDFLGTSPYAPLGATWREAVEWGGFGNQKNWDAALLARRRADGDQRGFGMALAGYLLRACLARRVEVATGCAAARLVVADGRVRGVEVQPAADAGVGGVQRVEARAAVVLATGGYEGNPFLVRNYEGLPEWESMFPPTVTGDGLVMAAEVGGAVYRVPENLRVHLGFRMPRPGGGTAFHEAGIQELCMPHSVVVNGRGERFADESSFQDVINEARRFDLDAHRFANIPCFLILDAAFFDRYAFGGGEPGDPPPDWLDAAATPAELAVRLGVDPGGLSRTLEAFNRHAAAGEDPVFHRGSNPFSAYVGGDLASGRANLGTVARPPFYGVRLVPTGVSSAGLLTDTDGQVLSVRGRPIPGLYACGNAAANLEWGPGYQAGLSLARALTYGLLSARHIRRSLGGRPSR